MAMIALGIDVVLPAFPDLRSEFGLASDSTQVGLVVTAYFIGLALSQVAYGPLADRFGRRAVLFGSIALYLVGASMATFAPSLSVLVAARGIWGVAAGGPRVVVAAIVRDVYEGDRMARALSMIFAIFILVPVFAPSLGALVLLVGSWRHVFGFCVAYALGMAWWTRRLPETLDPENRIDRLSVRRIREAGRFVVSDRVSLGYTLAMTALYGVFASYLASSELMWAEVFDIREAFPIVFGGVASVMGIANLINGRLVERFGMVRLARRVLVAYMALALALAVFTLAADGRPPFWPFIIPLAVILMFQSSLLPNLNSRALEPMGRRAGTASAIIGIMSLGAGAVLGAVLDSRFDGTLVPFTLALVAAGVFAFGFITWAEAA